MEQTTSSVGGDLLSLLNAAPAATEASGIPQTYRMGRAAAETWFSIRGDPVPSQAEYQFHPESNPAHLALLLGAAWSRAQVIAGITAPEHDLLHRIKQKVLANFNTETGRTTRPSTTRTTETQRLHERLHSL